MCALACKLKTQPACPAAQVQHAGGCFARCLLEYVPYLAFPEVDSNRPETGRPPVMLVAELREEEPEVHRAWYLVMLQQPVRDEVIPVRAFACQCPAVFLASLF